MWMDRTLGNKGIKMIGLKILFDIDRFIRRTLPGFIIVLMCLVPYLIWRIISLIS